MSYTMSQDFNLDSTGMSGTGSPAVSQEEEAYVLLLHSLTHEDTEENFDRHCLLFEKWCRDYSEGIYICHLKYVLQLLEILRSRIESHSSLFLPILPLVLRVLSKPLLEAKANERLRSVGIEDIKKLFLQITKFFEVDINSRKAVAICFRCIVSGGIDPTALKADAVEWVSDGNTSAQIKDTNYIQTLFRESGAVDEVVLQFQWCVDAYLYELSEFLSASQTVDGSGSPLRSPGGGNAQDDSDDEGLMSMSQPRRFTNSADEGGSPGAGAGSEDISSYISTKKLEASILQDLSRAMLDLSLDLANNRENAAHMCKMKLCDSAIKLLSESVSAGSCRDERASITVELMWTVLEAYFAVLHDAEAAAEDGGLMPVEEVKYDENGDRIYDDVIEFEPAVYTLKEVLLQLLREGYKLADKEVRNEVLIVLTILAKFPAAFPSFVTSGLLTVLVTYSCIGESGKKAWPFLSQPLAKFRNFATVFEVDLQFKRELWMLIGDLLRSDDVDAITCVASSPLLTYMSSFLDRNSLIESTQMLSANKDEPPATAGTTADNTRNNTAVGNNVGFLSTTNSMMSLFDKNGSAVETMQESSSNLTPGFQLAPDQGGSPPMSPTGQGQEMGSPYGANSTMGKTQASAMGMIKARDRLNGLATQRLTQLDKDSKASNSFLSSIPTTELRELQVLVMIFFAENAHKMMGEFMRIGGPIKALDIIYMYCTSTYAEHKRLVYYALLLQNRCIMNSNSAKKILETENAIQIWLHVFEISDEDSTRAVAARLIAIMCDGNTVCQTQLRQLKGIELLIGALAKYTDMHKPVVGKKAGIKLGQHTDNDLENPDDFRSGGEVSVLIVAVLDCLCKGVVGNPRNESKLAQVEGVDALLDLLEVSEFLLRIKVLRVLSGLLQNQSLITFLSAWRSAKTMRSAAQIFCHCYIDEETRLNCSRENGVINNLWCPLGNHNWPPDISIPPTMNGLGANDARSMTVTRLTNAILASRNVNSNGMTDQVRESVLLKDTRGIIVSVLDLMGLLGMIETAPSSPQGTVRGGGKKNNQKTIAGMRKSSNVSSYDNDPPPPMMDAYGADVSPMDGGVAEMFSNNDEEMAQYALRGDSLTTDGDEENTCTDTTVSSATLGVPGIQMSDDEQNGIRPMEKQVISIAKRYQVLLEGEWWLGVSLLLKEEGISPIDADLQMIDGHLSRYFEAARTVQFEQMELHGLSDRMKMDEEGVFIGSIIKKKNAQIKAEWLKKNSKMTPKAQSILTKIR